MQDTDVVVIGGGLAGLTAADEAARLGLRCTAFTGPAPGGLLLSIESVQDIAEHPDGIPGYDLCPIAHEAAMDAGAAFIDEEADSLAADGDGWVASGGGQAVRARAVILAPGSRLRPLGVPGEDSLFGKGVSHCANCDGPLLRGKPVAVVGGGDAACQEALTLAAHASTVHLLVRGPVLRARPSWQQRVRDEPKIQLHLDARVEAIEGEQAVQAVRLHDGSSLAVDAVFVYAGLLPNTEWLRGTAVPLADDGRIRTNDALRCDAPGVLVAAGSARHGNGNQAADAIADGVAAAHTAQRLLNAAS